MTTFERIRSGDPRLAPSTDLDVALAHSREELPQPPAAFNLFGHNADVMPDSEGVRYLNGVLGINVILVESGEVSVLPYPLYVDDARSCKRKRGL